MAKINETLRQLRMDRGMTQEEVAEQVGLTRQAVSGYESGRTQPGLDILQRLADIYEVEMTDIIYGRSRFARLRNALKITAIALAAVILVAQLAEALLLWACNQFFALEPGTMTDAELLIWGRRSQLLIYRTNISNLYFYLFPICCVALLVLTLWLYRPLAAKTKLLCVAGFAAASMVVVLPWALTDPVYTLGDYLLMPVICLARLGVTLLLSLIIDFFRIVRRKRKESAALAPTEQK